MSQDTSTNAPAVLAFWTGALFLFFIFTHVDLRSIGCVLSLVGLPWAYAFWKWWPNIPIPGKKLLPKLFRKISPAHKITAAFFGVMSLLFAALSVWSYVPGKSIFDKTFSVKQIEDEKPDAPHGRFTLDSRQVIQLALSNPELRTNWNWLKVAILDNQDRVVGDYSAELSQYNEIDLTGEGREASKTFELPAGTYKLLVYGENIEFYDIRVEVFKDVVLARYFNLGGLGFFVLFWGFLIYANRRSRRRVRDELLALDVSDEVVWDGDPYTVDGKLQYDEDGWKWYDFALLGRDEVLWLSIDAETCEVTIWRKTDALSAPGHHTPENFDYIPEDFDRDGDTYQKTESGHAQVERIGETRGAKQGSAMEYHDYQGPDSKKFSVEEWPDGAEYFTGQSISPYDVQLRDAST